jgi:hypothetical protein
VNTGSRPETERGVNVDGKAAGCDIANDTDGAVAATGVELDPEQGHGGPGLQRLIERIARQRPRIYNERVLIGHLHKAGFAHQHRGPGLTLVVDRTDKYIG